MKWQVLPLRERESTATKPDNYTFVSSVSGLVGERLLPNREVESSRPCRSKYLMTLISKLLHLHPRTHCGETHTDTQAH